MNKNFYSACLVALLMLLGTPTGNAKTLQVVSPDSHIKVSITVNDDVTYAVDYHGKPLLAPSRIDLLTRQTPSFTQSAVVKNIARREIDRVLSPEVKVKSQSIRDHFNELSVSFESGKHITFRVFNDGLAYRFSTDVDERLVVTGELAEFNFAGQAQVYFAEEESFYSHNERSYTVTPASEISDSQLGSLPGLVKTDAGNVLLTETALRDYAGMWLSGTGNNALKGTFPRLPTKTEMGAPPWEDRNQPVTERADYIAETTGSRDFPWRILAVASSDSDLLTNQLSYQLAEPSKIADTSWIKPGKVAWDWYNANNIHGVDFKAGLNTETYKYYIDFAADYGIEYVILDEGWYPLGDLMGSVDGFDVPEIIAYAKQKGVGIILWATWLTLYEQFEEAMDRFASLGAVGIKPDFFQRDDQEMVNFYWKIAEAAAERNLLVDFHGAYKPAGLRRTYPNVITREGVKGLEWNKWSDESTPEHNTTLPFIRMVAGPMDYTPGAMSNAVGPAAFEAVTYNGKDENHKDFAIRFNRPMSQTTRVHQMAMFTVFESPLQMMADSPTRYREESESAGFIAKVPTVWDETIPLHGKIGDYVAVARRAGDNWFVGAMNDEHPRTLPLSLDFLPEGRFDIVIFQDGINADRWAEDYKVIEKNVDRSTVLDMTLAPGGGYTARIVPHND
ncbi:glycoside hydrolase family 97 protein [Alteromonas halophila]|uniref:Retaining alpha-galactosidase n=1 Tax=Alteromonas halophila TaxID=516698 RepID=A0A918MXQ6_9ALTE|nr:glycoside hydrolase family 97 protein [Alteromonas halophila]GGW81015.1 retaining alpha-galactosidase [Alteromonas halophila]